MSAIASFSLKCFMLRTVIVWEYCLVRINEFVIDKWKRKKNIYLWNFRDLKLLIMYCNYEFDHCDPNHPYTCCTNQMLVGKVHQFLTHSSVFLFTVVVSFACERVLITTTGFVSCQR